MTTTPHHGEVEWGWPDYTGLVGIAQDQGAVDRYFDTGGLNDHIPIQAMIDYLNARGGGIGEIASPPAAVATYDIRNTLTQYEHTWLRGSGVRTVLTLGAAVDMFQSPAGLNRGMKISDMKLDANGENNILINWTDAYYGWIKDNFLYNALDDYIQINDASNQSQLLHILNNTFIAQD